MESEQPVSIFSVLQDLLNRCTMQGVKPVRFRVGENQVRELAEDMADSTPVMVNMDGSNPQKPCANKIEKSLHLGSVQIMGLPVSVMERDGYAVESAHELTTALTDKLFPE